MIIEDRLRSIPPLLIFLTAAVLVVVVGFVDSTTGQEISFSIFYLIPVMLSGWVCAKPQRWAICGFSAVTSFLADLAMNSAFSVAWIPYWNALARLGIFLVAGELTARLAGRNRALQAEIGERRLAEIRLQELNATLEAKVAERTAAAEERSVLLCQSEAAMRKQAEVLQSILNSMGDGVIVFDAEGRITLRNPEARRMLQFEDEIPSLHSWLANQRTYLPEAIADRHDEIQHPLLRVLGGESVDVAEMLIDHRKGEAGTWARTTARPLVDAKREVTGGVIVFHDITDRKLLEKQVAEISDREQQRIGQDLHDGVCQHLVSTAMACTMLADTLQEHALPQAKQAAEISQLIKDAAVQARSLAHALYCIDLTGEGLATSFEELAERVQNTTRIGCQFHCSGAVAIGDSGAALNLFRIAQEAVANSIKHGAASEIVIQLKESDCDLTLTISDNGVGFTATSNPGNGLGLHIMNYRARMIGASLSIESSPSGGVLVSCKLPRQNPKTHAS